eukprot:m.155057 g.155057  ORF g.155057 m.155057 type:complete len:77 (+) comp38653_c0_seq1:2721-2951(+)
MWCVQCARRDLNVHLKVPANTPAVVAAGESLSKRPRSALFAGVLFVLSNSRKFGSIVCPNGGGYARFQPLFFIYWI